MHGFVICEFEKYWKLDLYPVKHIWSKCFEISSTQVVKSCTSAHFKWKVCMVSKSS